MTSGPDDARPQECPCGRGEPYATCCGPIHSGDTAAPTAERLMRSRFSAFALGNAGYLLDSWHPETRPAENPADFALDETVSWQQLFIENTAGGGPFDSEGCVTFTATGRTPAGRFTQRERSRFVRDTAPGGGSHWFYIDGEEP